MRKAIVFAASVALLAPTLLAQRQETGLAVQSWKYDHETRGQFGDAIRGVLALELVNLSGKDITAYNISITLTYADGSTDYTDGRPNTPGEHMEDLLGWLIIEQMTGEKPPKDQPNGIFAAGTTRSLILPQAKDLSDVKAVVDMAEALNTPITQDIDASAQPETILWQVLRDTEFSGGVAKLQDCSTSPQLHLKATRGTSIRLVMDSLVAENSNYAWELRGGTINLIEKPGLPPLLATKLHRFKVDTTDKEIGAIFFDLMRRPEIQRRVAELKLEPGIQTGGPGVAEENPKPRQPVPIHFSIDDGSLQDAFNRIARSDGRMIWVYSERDCEGHRTYVVDVWHY